MPGNILEDPRYLILRFIIQSYRFAKGILCAKVLLGRGLRNESRVRFTDTIYRVSFNEPEVKNFKEIWFCK